MNLPRYELIITWSPRDGVFVARVPELPGCMAHGATYEATLANIQDAMHLWLDTALQDGIPIPQPAQYAAST